MIFDVPLTGSTREKPTGDPQWVDLSELLDGLRSGGALTAAGRRGKSVPSDSCRLVGGP